MTINSHTKDAYNQSDFKIAVLGGGLSGLTIGYLLGQKGINYEILEKAKFPGGLMRTLRESGFSFDYGGSHIIFSKSDLALHFILTLLKKNHVKNKRRTKILYKNSLVKYPFENGLSDLSEEENFECLNTFVKNLLEKKSGNTKETANLRDWFYSTFGSGIAEKYLIPYNEKIWKFPVEKMGLNWVERIPDPPVEDIIKSSLGIETEGYTHQLYFYYPIVGGIEAIIRSLKFQTSKRITTGYDIKKIRHEEGRWFVSNGTDEKTFDKIVSTIPIQQLVNSMDVPNQVKTATKELKYNSLITIMLGINKKGLIDLSWLYIPDKKILTHRVSFPSNYSPQVVPPGKSSVLAEITCRVDDEVWEMSDCDLIDRTVSDLSDRGLIDKRDVCFKRVNRIEYAYVISDLDYTDNLNIVQKYFQQIGIDLVGRFAEFKYMNMDACVESAMNYIKGV